MEGVTPPNSRAHYPKYPNLKKIWLKIHDSAKLLTPPNFDFPHPQMQYLLRTHGQREGKTVKNRQKKWISVGEVTKYKEIFVHRAFMSVGVSAYKDIRNKP